jgi:hypothetical protein
VDAGIARAAARRRLIWGAGLAAALGVSGLVLAQQPAKPPQAAAKPPQPAAATVEPIAPPQETVPPDVAAPPAPLPPVLRPAVDAAPPVAAKKPPVDPAAAAAAAATAAAVAAAANKPPEAPKPLRSPSAIMQALDKVTAETIRFEAPVGKRIRYKTLVFTVKACETTGVDDPQPQSSAYLIIESEPRPIPGHAAPPVKQVYKGWMFSTAPGFHPMEHPVYDAWLIACSASPPPAQAAILPQTPRPSIASAKRKP